MGGSSSKKQTQIPQPPSNKIQLANQSISEIPLKHLECKDIEEAWLQGNSITSLPDDVRNWSKLELFYIADNQITEIPTVVSNWISLEEVNFR